MLIILLGMLVFAVTHSLLASQTVKQAFQRRFGEHAYHAFYRLGYNAFASLSATPIILLLYSHPGKIVWRIPEELRIVMLALQVTGLILLVFALAQIDLARFAGLRQVHAYLKNQPLPLPPEKLQTSGVYRIVRHPVYLASILLLWSGMSMTESWLVFDITVTLYAFIGSWFEEKRMIATFGQEYADYKNRVPLLIPFPRPFRANPKIDD